LWQNIREINTSSLKILVVGSDKVYAIENFYVKYFRELGVEADHFSAQSIFFDYYEKNLPNKLLFKAGISSVYAKINRLLIDRILKFEPEIVFIFKGMEIFPQTLDWIRKQGIKTVNYNPDNPFIFSGKGSGNKNVSKSILFYDLHLTYNRSVQLQLEATTNGKVGYLPFGYDVNDEFYDRIGSESEAIDACFVGNPDIARARVIKELASEGLRIHVFGFGWRKFVNDAKILIHEAVLAEELFFTLRRYRVQLNLLRPHNLDSHNMRTFEVPAVGGIMVAPSNDEHKAFFEHGKEVLLFENISQCASVIKEVLHMPSHEAAEIRNAARQRCVGSGYSYKERARQSLQLIESL
jgi:spore maturation protein CgeB